MSRVERTDCSRIGIAPCPGHEWTHSFHPEGLWLRLPSLLGIGGQTPSHLESERCNQHANRKRALKSWSFVEGLFPGMSGWT